MLLYTSRAFHPKHWRNGFCRSLNPANRERRCRKRGWCGRLVSVGTITWKHYWRWLSASWLEITDVSRKMIQTPKERRCGCAELSASLPVTRVWTPRCWSAPLDRSLIGGQTTVAQSSSTIVMSKSAWETDAWRSSTYRLSGTSPCTIRNRQLDRLQRRGLQLSRGARKARGGGTGFS